MEYNVGTDGKKRLLETKHVFIEKKEKSFFEGANFQRNQLFQHLSGLMFI